jgi:hypothetical protein
MGERRRRWLPGSRAARTACLEGGHGRGRPEQLESGGRRSDGMERARHARPPGSLLRFLRAAVWVGRPASAFAHVDLTLAESTGRPAAGSAGNG